MARAKTTNGKREALARDGALNRHPESVRDALFAENPFFDPDDLVQVRYEMVRRHEVDGQMISGVATARRHRGAVRDQGPSTQFGARPPAQKKMTRPGPSISAIQPATAYETLRAAILTGHSNGQPGLAIIIHRGVTAWVGELMSESRTLMPSSLASGPSIRSTAPAPTPNELIHVLAGIIVTLATGDAPTNA